MLPETRYATASDGVELAYQRFGRGSHDLVWLPHLLVHLDLLWDAKPIASWLEGLGTLGRVLIRDMRGTGLSDRSVEPGDIATDVADVLRIMDAEGIERATLVGNLRGSAVAALAAALHPDRVSELVLWQPQVSGRWTPDYPWGMTDAEQAGQLATMMAIWGTEVGGERMAAGEGPHGIVDLSFQRWMARMMRSGLNRARARSLVLRMHETDVRAILRTIGSPTLVLARTGAGADEARWVASQIPGAEIIELQGSDLMPWFGDLRSVLAAIGRFLGIEHAPSAGALSLATVLFTDIVGSTERAADVGDARWAETIVAHHRLVRDRLERFGGREQDTAGDGFFATFDSPADAIRCGLAVAGDVRVLGLEVRAGVHTGECRIVDGKVAGLAVAVGARIAAAAGSSEVLVSSTVRDLVAGSGLTFEDAGEHELKGVPDRWRLYRVVG